MLNYLIDCYLKKVKINMNIVSNERAINIAASIIFFGLIAFYSGIYLFPDVGDTARVFYVLIMLPMLYVMLSLNKDFLSNKYIWLLMLLPIYLTITHFWAKDENIIKSEFFHIKKVVYILFFIVAVFFIFTKKPKFLRLLLQFLFVAGAISAVISIACFLSTKCGITAGRLSAFSIQDINKAGAMYTLHMGLSAFFLFYGFSSSGKDKFWVKGFLIISFFVSGLAVYYAKTNATWLMLVIILFFTLAPKWSIKSVASLFFLSFLGVGLFIYFDGYAVLMQDSSFEVRSKLVQASIESAKNNKLFGLGITHKLPLLGQLHPHNIFADIYRFGGLVGLSIFIWTLLYLFLSGIQVSNSSILAKFCLAWFVGGIAIMTVYAQQPITRPGGYIWFFYWMPIVLLAAEISRVKSVDKEKC